MRVTRTRSPGTESEEDAVLREDAEADTSWKEALLSRLHNLSPEGFEEFVMYLLRTFGLELTPRWRVRGTRALTASGLLHLAQYCHPIVAVQAKRYKPTDSVGRGVRTRSFNEMLVSGRSREGCSCDSRSVHEGSKTGRYNDNAHRRPH